MDRSAVRRELKIKSKKDTWNLRVKNEIFVINEIKSECKDMGNVINV